MPSAGLVVLCVLLAVSCFQCCDARKKRENEKSLELIHVLFRHGDRTPDKKNMYPNDPHYNESSYPVGFGELTKDGRAREYLLGKSLRKRYGKFLGPYNSYAVEGRSTYFNRTKVSLELVLAGLYPPRDDQVFYRHLKWQPIPFEHGIAGSDYLLGFPESNCPAYTEKAKEYKKTDEYQAMQGKYKHIFEYLTHNSGKIINSTYGIAELLFTLYCQDELGLKLPDWIKKVYPKALEEALFDEYARRTATKDLKKLGSGFLVKKILRDTEIKLSGKAYEKRKIFLYSGHEYNIANLLHFLDVYNENHVPPYGAYIVIEVHKLLNSTYGFKILYNRKRTPKPDTLILPGCTKICPVKRFMELYGELLPDSTDECSRSTTFENATSKTETQSSIHH